MDNIKSKMHSLLSNPAGKLIAVDLDGTLCNGEFWGDTDPTPKQDMIDLLWSWYKKGAHVVIYTARAPKHYAITLAWLIKNEVPFHGIAMQVKIGADIYIDDKALNIEDL